MDNFSKEVECKKITALLLYSGGYDSVAMLHKMITTDDFDEITVLFTDSDNLNGEYEKFNAKTTFDILNEQLLTEKKYKVKLNFIVEKASIEWLKSPTEIKNRYYNRDICLLTHLTTIIRHGEINNWYLGWNKSNIVDLDISKKLFNWFEKHKKNDYNIFFLETYFSGKNAVIDYLFKNNLFHLGYTNSDIETIKEYNERDYWFKNDLKNQEVLSALFSIDYFEEKDFKEIYSLKTTKEVQEFYNKKKEISVNVEKANEE